MFPRANEIPSWNRRGSRERLFLIASGGVVAHRQSPGKPSRGTIHVSDPRRFAPPLLFQEGSQPWLLTVRIPPSLKEEVPEVPP